MRKLNLTKRVGYLKLQCYERCAILCTDFAEAKPLPLLKNIGHDFLKQEEKRSPCGTSRRILTLLIVPRKRFW
jgi:hypothetical protein